MTRKQAHLIRKERLVIMALTAALLLFLLIAGMVFYRYTTGKLYNESVSQLEELSTQLFEKLEVQIDLQWNYLDKITERLEGTDSMTTEELQAFFTQCEKDLAPAGKTIKFRAIDSDGYYYTDEGRQGFWTGLDSLTDSDHQSFLISNWLDNENYMAFCDRLNDTFEVNGSEITYFILLRSMTDMQPFFHSSAFGDRNNVYIIETYASDTNGLILYEDCVLEGVEFEGRNLSHSMEEQTYPHMQSYQAVLQAGATGDTVCTDVIINGEKYYLLYNVMRDYDWGILMLFDAGDVATSASEMMDSMLQTFVFTAILLLGAFSAIFIFISRLHKNRKVMELREKNEEILRGSNERLESVNKELESVNKELESVNKELESVNKELDKSRIAAEESAETATKATKAKSQFLANMSHDIRTPMNAITGITALMEHDVNDPEKLSYYIRKIQHSSQHMLGLINDILDMSKIESGEVRLSEEPVKLAEQVGQVESIIRSQSNERGQEFTVVVHNIAHEYLIGDSIRLRQVYLNLLNNAVKYTQYGGNIRFELAELPSDNPDEALIMSSVIDNGYGMTKEFLQRIFEPFARAEDSVTNKIQGTGLGMSITKSIIDLMGGTITVESEIDKGSRFDVTIPFPIDRAADYNAGISSVMLISSEELLVTNVRVSLSETPVELTVASTPDEAVSILREKHVDAVMLAGFICDNKLSEDVSMLRESAGDALFIFCCDYAYKEHVRQVLTSSGVDGLISRPFFFENMKLAIEHVKKHASPDEHEKRLPLSGKRFLCAEDNELNAEILEALLNVNNASCTIYPTGLELVRAFDNVKPGEYDAILMDVQMPQMNGIDATKCIRTGSNPLGKTIPIIAMTANAFSTDVQDCLDAGMNAHLAKPLDISALERTLQEVMNGKNAGGGDTCPLLIDISAAE